MAFTTTDIETLKKAKAEGLTKEQALARLSQTRSSTTTPPTTSPAVDDSASADLRTGFQNAQNAVNQGVDRQVALNTQGRSEASSRFGSFANGLRTAGDALGSIGAGVFRALPGGTTVSNAVESVAKAGAEKVAPSLAKGFDWASAFVPAGAENTVKDLGNVALGGLGVAGSITGGSPAVNAAKTAGTAVVNATVDATQATGRAVTNSPLVKGAIQTGIDYTERVPRFLGRREQELRDQATKAERLATASEPIRKALQANVPEPIINTIEQADDATKEGYRQIVQLAEESISTTGTLKTTARPEIVAGEAVASQYKLVDQQRKKVGQAIGEQVRALSTDRAVPMARPRAALNEALQDVGVTISQGGDGSVALNFGKTGFTKAQRAKINELFELATEGGDSLTPAQIHAKDRLFSQLQREARMEGMGDILVPNPADPDGRQISLFQAFRDVYTNTLEEAAPEIRNLNRQYRNLSTFTDEIEDTLVKSGKFETNSRVDPSEYAQTNLRRLFSEAQSAADYRAIADELDNASRALGYQGAVPSDLARFAFEIRKIYPDSTPRTGLEGAIRSSTSVGSVIDTVLNAGRPELVDQQKALRELFDSIESLPQKTE